MNAPLLSVSRRTRKTPFTKRVNASGVKAYTVYNQMLLPTVFDSVEADYHHLKTHVQVWDVSCERQIEIQGPDAFRLLQMLTPRDLSKLTIGKCMYIPTIDEAGGMLNDPVALKIAEDQYWVSIADSELLLWVKGLAYGMKFDVYVHEPDVYPLAVQGPKADELMARVFGEQVRDIGFFKYARLPFEGQDLIIARSGYSKQGGYEIYVEGQEIGEPLWDALFAAGEDLNVRPGGPNLIERIEAGLLSYGNDMTRNNSPYECGLGNFCQVEKVTGCVGREVLMKIAERGPVRQIRSLSIDGEAVPPCTHSWPVYVDGIVIGRVTSAVWSPDFGTNVALGMIRKPHWDEGTRVEVETPDGMRGATVKEDCFISRS